FVTYSLSLHDALPICYLPFARLGMRTPDFPEAMTPMIASPIPHIFYQRHLCHEASSLRHFLLSSMMNRNLFSRLHLPSRLFFGRSEEHTSELQSLRHL